ncbi:Receptor expression-enhancing protein 3 [Larimichthys crocea]|uniref:Uncharacterized protein n=1 Tax=Larimichthys crocea TaxID=215358 RepID=A0ACD3RSR7_LARCR|nr:Receptor expression-enhancing protein 3 [Larimichthys crocea]
MVSWIISRSVVLVFGTLYPAYYSYKAVKTKNVKEYLVGCSTYAHGSVSSAAPVFMLCLPSLALQVGPVAVKS